MRKEIIEQRCLSRKDTYMNVKAPYLSLDAAREIIATTGASWEGSAWQKVAHDEGWNIFNLTLDHRAPTDAGIERYDEPLEHGCPFPLDFDSDEAVIRYCQKKATAGDNVTHRTALQIEHALNSLRYHLWGEDYVDSRCGPSEPWDGRSSTLRNEQALGIAEYAKRHQREGR